MGLIGNKCEFIRTIQWGFMRCNRNCWGFLGTNLLFKDLQGAHGTQLELMGFNGN